MAKINAGALDSRISVMIPFVSFNTYNEPEETMEDYAELWAKKSDVSSSESFRAQEVGSEITTRFTLRWSPVSARIDTRFTIRHGGSTYNITGSREIGRGDWIEIDAVARAESSEVFEVSSP